MNSLGKRTAGFQRFGYVRLAVPSVVGPVCRQVQSRTILNIRRSHGRQRHISRVRWRVWKLGFRQETTEVVARVLSLDMALRHQEREVLSHDACYIFVWPVVVLSCWF